jgi:hypothetical protein
MYIKHCGLTAGESHMMVSEIEGGLMSKKSNDKEVLRQEQRPDIVWTWY